ncbi:MAG: hypothetical protein ACI89X_003290 [Planctomycetota bacterium]|jgi:hypothetical protein
MLSERADLLGSEMSERVDVKPGQLIGPKVPESLLPACASCHPGQPNSVRLQFTADAEGVAELGLLPGTFVEGMAVSASGQVLRIARTSIAPVMRLVVLDS